MRRSIVLAAVLAAPGGILLSACVPPPRSAEILVSTTPPGAACTLTRAGRPIAAASPTPAIALVEPSDGDIAVMCRREGFAHATATLSAHQVWPDLSLITHGTAPFDYPHRVDLALTPMPVGAGAR